MHVAESQEDKMKKQLINFLFFYLFDRFLKQTFFIAIGGCRSINGVIPQRMSISIMNPNGLINIVFI